MNKYYSGLPKRVGNWVEVGGLFKWKRGFKLKVWGYIVKFVMLVYGFCIGKLVNLFVLFLKLFIFICLST